MPGQQGLFEIIEKGNNQPCPGTVEVAFNAAVDQTFTYLVPISLWPVEPGQRVLVPFGRNDKPRTGICTAVRQGQAGPEGSNGKILTLKPILKVIDPQPLIDASLLDLARWISDYYLCPVGQVLAAMVPGPLKQARGLRPDKAIYLLTEDQGVIGAVKGENQARLIMTLLANKAVDQDHAIAIKQLLSQAKASMTTLTSLVRKGLVGVVELPPVTTQPSPSSDRPVLTADQAMALDRIVAQIEQGSFGVVVLHGVTGSGKTEVYIRAVEHVLTKGRSAIVLLPEIALTTQTLIRFTNRLGQVAVLHSGLTPGQRYRQWQLVRTGHVKVVVGARSAVFGPVEGLGLIIVDEEHDPSYKQQTSPRYHARDVAIKRAQLARATCILGSATPSLETLYNCQSRPHFSLVSLPRRVNDLPLPQMRLVDLRYQGQVASGRYLISEPLLKAVEGALSRSEQAILLLNRRGYSQLVMCPRCRYLLICRNCDTAMTFHRSKRPKATGAPAVSGPFMEAGLAICHYCMAQTLVPADCPLCKAQLKLMGIGSQRLEEELRLRFPKARIARLDSDSMDPRTLHARIEEFSAGQIDILAGTQMIAKGLDFPKVTVVGIISADLALTIPDFRCNERTFQLICQVAGRAGRADRPGAVYVQTFMPEQMAIRFAIAHDVAGFYRTEIQHRQASSLPPVWRMTLVHLQDPSWEKLRQAADGYKAMFEDTAKAHGLEVRITGPIPAPISRIQRQHRLQIILRAPDTNHMQRFLALVRRQRPKTTASKVIFDVDPVNLL